MCDRLSNLHVSLTAYNSPVHLIEERATKTVDWLLEYCEFGEERVYLLMAIARAKENPSINSNAEVVFLEVLKHEQDPRRKFEQLQALARNYRSDSGDELTFRLYITANARNTVKAYFNFRSRMNDWTKEWILVDETTHRKLKHVDRHWLSATHRDNARDETRFLFDLDDATSEELKRLRDALDEQTEIITWRETPNGYHVVTEPFNYNELAVDADYELKTDGMLFVRYLTRPSE